jgi:GrpB-like predicted nucleotidyltransferase (UPF0157 family)
MPPEIRWRERSLAGAGGRLTVPEFGSISRFGLREYIVGDQCARCNGCPILKAGWIDFIPSAKDFPGEIAMSRDGRSRGVPTATHTSEERLASITVGERKPLDSTIQLADYESEWATNFSELAERIQGALSQKVLLLEHVGSTSVPGLSAKPIIDMVLAVADSADETSYVPALEARGFALRIREPDWHEHRLLKFIDPDAHLHVFSSPCSEIDRMLAFRDRLRLDEGDRRLYAEAKRVLAARTWRHVQHYADAKSAVVGEILGRCE